MKTITEQAIEKNGNLNTIIQFQNNTISLTLYANNNNNNNNNLTIISESP